MSTDCMEVSLGFLDVEGGKRVTPPTIVVAGVLKVELTHVLRPSGAKDCILTDRNTQLNGNWEFLFEIRRVVSENI